MASRAALFTDLDFPPELLVGLAKLIKALVRAELQAAPARDARVRHDRTGLPRERALAAIHSGELVARKLGKFWYIEPAALDAYFAAHGKTKAEAGAEEDEFVRALAGTALRKGAKKPGRR